MEVHNLHPRAIRKEAGHEKSTIKYVGMNVHKDTIIFAIANESRPEETRTYGTFPHTRGV